MEYFQGKMLEGRKPLRSDDDHYSKEPSVVGTLGIIAMNGCEELMSKIDRFLVEWRSNKPNHPDYNRATFKIKFDCPRFGTGEGKGNILQSVRGHDIFIICDAFNHGVKYRMYGELVPMSPDDHFQDLKRIISAISGKARRITVVMPMLYEGRQHRRSSRESLDCAMALQELAGMDVENIITFDAHDPRVQNAIPLISLEDVHPTYQMVKAFVNSVTNIDWDNILIISPDEGGMSRCIYYSTVLGLDLGMFYKRRDYTKIVNGRNPIIGHEFLGSNLGGRDVIVVDDMISSGDSILDVCNKLKSMGAHRVYVFATFGLFTDGVTAFNEAYEQGLIDMVFTTNAVYRRPELPACPWYREVDLSKYIAYIIDTINHDDSISTLLNPSKRISDLLIRRGYSPRVPAPSDPA